MAKAIVSTKRIAISKANAQIVAAVAIASFVTVFCLVASKDIWSQNRYLSKVSGADEKTNKRLDDDLKAFESLSVSYNNFDSKNPNIIGGNSSGTDNNSGSNSRIILDALPAAYDFPALTSSLEKILNDGKFKIGSIVGIDDQLNQQGNLISNNPQPVIMPFTFTVSQANISSVQQLVSTLQSSIRPIQIDKIDLNGSNNDMDATIEAHTYYQPGKSLQVTKKVIK